MVRRVAALHRIDTEAGGQEWLARSLGALKGPLGAKEAGPLRAMFSDAEVDALFNRIKDVPEDVLMRLEKTSTTVALQDLILSGRIPTRTEMQHLEAVFGPEMGKALMAMRPWGDKARAMLFDFLGLPKALKASLDDSFGGRQGLLLVNNPAWWKSWGPSLKAFASEKAALQTSEAIVSHELWPLARQMQKDGKLYLAPMGKITTRLSEREEMFFTRFADRIPFVKWSNRAFVTFGNKLRSDYFYKGTQRILAKYPDVQVNTSGLLEGEQAAQAWKEIGDFARWTSHATGRGDLPAMGETLQAVVNAGFFSPRFVTSRFQSAGEIAKGVAKVAVGKATYAEKEAARNGVLAVMEGLAALGLAKMSGASVEIDPRSSEFGKVKIGNSTLDIWAGFQQPARYISQLIMGQRKVLASGKIVPQSRLSTLYRFGESKSSPTGGLVTTVLRGTDFVGEKLGEGVVQRFLSEQGLLEPASKAVQLLTDMGMPMTAEDLYEAVLLESWLAVPFTGLAAAGVSVQTYKAKTSDRPTRTFTPRPVRPVRPRAFTPRIPVPAGAR